MKTNMRTLPICRLSMILIFALFLLMSGTVTAAGFDRTYPGYDALLKQYVTDGRVDYQGLKSDPSPLDHYLDSLAGISEATFNGWTEPAQLAFLINLYNAATLKLILDHYPIDSIKDIGSFFKGPWDQEVVRRFDKTIALDDLEHDIIRKQYDEPRIHMALVCAAKGCPTLRSEAYVAEKLDAQLDDQSRLFLTSPAGLRIDRGKNRVYFSSIFKWYGKDFVGRYSPSSGFTGLSGTERAVANFSSKYLAPSESDYLQTGGYSIKYLDYDWSLNEK